MTPRAASEMGAFSTNRARQMASAFSRFERLQYWAGGIGEKRKNSASR